jgi:hypothetical protein
LLSDYQVCRIFLGLHPGVDSVLEGSFQRASTQLRGNVKRAEEIDPTSDFVKEVTQEMYKESCNYDGHSTSEKRYPSSFSRGDELWFLMRKGRRFMRSLLDMNLGKISSKLPGCFCGTVDPGRTQADLLRSQSTGYSFR